MKAVYFIALVLSAQAMTTQSEPLTLSQLEAWDSHEDGNDHHMKEAFAAEVKENEARKKARETIVEDPNSVKSLLKNAAEERKKSSAFSTMSNRLRRILRRHEIT